MKILEDIRPTPEQLPIISGAGLGVTIIRGAAGSGKTHTAVLSLKILIERFLAQRRREENSNPVKVLILTYNRTLATYVSRYVDTKSEWKAGADVQVSTFAKWAKDKTSERRFVDERLLNHYAGHTGHALGLSGEFLRQEIEYVCGRFTPENLDEYLDVERRGRGIAPRMEKAARATLVDAIKSYNNEKQMKGIIDWNDLALQAMATDSVRYDIIVVDESQDFSANQLRAVIHHMSDSSSLTLIIDTAQRLYPRGYTWREVGVRADRFHRLKQNHRNTIEIAQFAAGLVQGLKFDEDGTMPDFQAAAGHGSKPVIFVGQYEHQVNYALEYITENIALADESVAFLKPRGGRWFSRVEEALQKSDLAYENITRTEEWPSRGIGIVLSTMHSAKGLEFDHVFMLGFSAEVMPHEEDPDDDRFLALRRLVAMAAARAKKTLHIGYKSGEESDLVGFFREGTYEKIER